jgi:hypothetical protein
MFLGKGSLGGGLLMGSDLGGDFMNFNHVMIMVPVSIGRNAQRRNQDSEEAEEDEISKAL